MGTETINSERPRIHNAEEAAAILKVKTSWLKEQARQRRIPFSLLSGSYRFSDRHLEQIVKIFEQRPQDPEGRPRAPRKMSRTEQAADTTQPASASRPLRARRPQRRLPSSPR